MGLEEKKKVFAIRARSGKGYSLPTKFSLTEWFELRVVQSLELSFDVFRVKVHEIFVSESFDYGLTLSSLFGHYHRSLARS